MRAWRSVLVTVAASSIIAWAGPPHRGAAAVTGPAAGTAPTAVRLLGHTVAVAPGGDLLVDLELGAGVDASTGIVVSARRLPDDRDGLRAGLVDTSAAPDDEVLASLAGAATGEPVRLTVPTESAGDDPDRLLLAASGAYALTVGTGPQQGFTTVIVRGERDSGEAPVARVAVALVVDSPLILQPDGTASVGPDVRGTVTRLVELLERTPVRVTVSIRPELVAGLGASGLPGDADLVSRLGVALGRHILLGVPYIAIDPSAAAAAGLQAVFTDQLRSGEDSLSAALGRFPDRRVWVALDPLSAEGASLVRDLGTNVIVRLAGAGTSPPSESAGRAPSGADVPVSRPRPTVPIIDPDPASALLAPGSVDPVLAAYRLAAELVAVHRDTTGAVLLPDMAAADMAVLDTLLGIVGQGNGLVAGRIDETIRPNAGEEAVPPGEGVVPPGEETTVVADLADVAVTRAELARMAVTTLAMLPAGETRGDRWTDLADALLDSRLTPADREDYASTLRANLVAVQRAVVVQSPSTVNLGDRSSTVPVTVRNDNPFPVVVEVRLVSAKLRIPPTSEPVTVPAGGTVQLRIPVDVRSNGRFPVTAELVAPGTGQRVGTPVTFSVRVGRLTGLGIVITFAAALILATWWVQHLRRRRRRQRGVASLDRHPVGSRRTG